MPKLITGISNSIWLGFKYLDNYSAGKKSVTGVSDSSSTDAEKDSNKNYRLNQDVRYTDYFGEIESFSIKMLSTLGTQKINDKTTAINVGNSLPVSTLQINNSNVMIDSNTDNISLKKDNREQINFAYQLHFTTNDNIIIGSQLAQNYGLVGTNTSNAKLYVLPNRINKFTNIVDLTNAVEVYDYADDINRESISYDEINERVIFTNKTTNANGKSWVIVDSSNNKLLFGKNIEINGTNETNYVIELPTMTFTHKYI